MNPGEFVRVQLKGGVTYLAELNSTGVALSLKPRNPGTQKAGHPKGHDGAAQCEWLLDLSGYAARRWGVRYSLRGVKSGAAVTLTLKAKQKN